MREWVVRRFANSWLAASLAVLALLAVWTGAVASGLVPSIAYKPKIKEPVYDLSIGYLVSYIFFLLVVALPERLNRRRTGRWLGHHYRAFKLSCIQIFLSAIGDSCDSELPESLLEPQQFRSYFMARHCPSQSRWDAVHNGLYECGLPELIIECELLAQELEFTCIKLDIEDDEVALLLKRLARSLRRLRVSQPTYNDIKQLLMLLYSLHANWSWAEGYLEHDPIERLVGKL